MAKTKEKSKKVNNIAVAMIVLLVLIISVVCVEIIITNFIEVNNRRVLMNSNIDYVKNQEFTEVVVNEKATFLENHCPDKDCYLSVDYFKSGKLYFAITKGNDGYILNIYSEKDRILSSRKIGNENNIKGTYLMVYNNNVVLFSLVEDGEYVYDAAFFVNESFNTDIFTSIEKDELQFTDNGVIYYYDTCMESEDNSTNGQRIKAVRMPFSKAPSILNVENDNFTWCN